MTDCSQVLTRRERVTLGLGAGSEPWEPDGEGPGPEGLRVPPTGSLLQALGYPRPFPSREPAAPPGRP